MAILNCSDQCQVPWTVHTQAQAVPQSICFSTSAQFGPKREGQGGAWKACTILGLARAHRQTPQQASHHHA